MTQPNEAPAGELKAWPEVYEALKRSNAMLMAVITQVPTDAMRKIIVANNIALAKAEQSRTPFQPTKEMVERVARAIMEAQPYNLSPYEAMNCARAAIAAIGADCG